MNIVYYKCPRITLTDTIGNWYELYVSSYEEYGDEIVIRTSLKETDLKRGWMGDLTCYMLAGANPENGSDMTDTGYDKKYCDVLLRSVEVDNAERDSVVMWKYTFLKD